MYRARFIPNTHSVLISAHAGDPSDLMGSAATSMVYEVRPYEMLSGLHRRLPMWRQERILDARVCNSFNGEFGIECFSFYYVLSYSDKSLY
jgi:hypothetical protein